MKINNLLIRNKIRWILLEKNYKDKNLKNKVFKNRMEKINKKCKNNKMY